MQKSETNIRKMLKIKRKMSFRARKVEMMTKIWIIGDVIDFTK